MKYQLKKQIWTEEDFEIMGWHDSKIYGFAFDENAFTLMLDIDYIFEWIDPLPGEKNFSFQVAPATLVFENVWNLRIEIGTNLELEISDIFKENPSQPKNSAHIGRNVEYEWRIELQHGEISFSSVGYKQYIRLNPILIKSQQLNLEERGGISFAPLAPASSWVLSPPPHE